MPWSASEPTDNTKIRLAPAVLRTNFAALETGGVPFDALQLQKQAGDPAAIADTGFVYSKDPGTGRTECYYEKDNGAVVPVTGSPTTIDVIRAATGAIIGKSYGVITGYGLTLNWGNYSMPASGEAEQIVTFAIPFTVVPHSVQLSRDSTSAAPAGINIKRATPPTTTECTILFQISALAPTLIYFFVIGV